ncbi:hypothetical protein [Jiangella asiatica]|nr:hypothetical protein [Jiangella asiatica]
MKPSISVPEHPQRPDASSVTTQIDRSLAIAGKDESSRAAAEAGRRRLAE